MQHIEMAANDALYPKNAESGALAGLVARIQRGDANSVHELAEDDFYLPSNRRVFCAIRSLAIKREPIDGITLDRELAILYPKYSDMDSPIAISAITDGYQYHNFRAYVRIIKDAAMRRKLVALSDVLADGAMDKTEDVEVLMDRVRGKLRDMVVTKGEWQSMSDVIVSTIENLEKRAKGEISGIKTGVSGIDQATGGFFPGELAVIGARPGVGKSAFAMQIAISAALKGKHVCVVSMEMVAEQYGERLIANATSIDGMKLRLAKLKDDDWFKITDVMAGYAHLPISYIFDSSTVEDVRNEVQRKVDLGECDMVIIDYLQLLKTKRRFEIEHERVAYVSHMVKQMTIDFKIPVVALAQVKRQNNGGRARCPVLDDLRSSGDIEQDADTVMFLHRPDDAGDPTVDRRDEDLFQSITERGYQYIVFSVAKQRQGQTGIIVAVFDPAHMRYISMDQIRKGDA